MQSTKIIASILFIMGMFFTSCEELLEPDNDNHSTTDRFFTDPAWAEGVLANAYVAWPNSYSFDEVATDDAVSNVKGNNYRRMATGEWSALFDPLSIWNSAYKQIFYINYFLGIVDDVDYAWEDKGSSSVVRDSLFKKRFKGEAYILRAWYNFELLKKHGGLGENDQALGFVILTKPITSVDNYNLPRSSYDSCVQFILNDINAGIALLPNDYVDIPGDIAYNKVFGNTAPTNKNRGRVNGRFGKALKSRVTLWVASQSIYNAAGKWDSAAVAAAQLLSTATGGVNGVAGMSANGHKFWLSENDVDVLFRRDYVTNNSLESANFPPSRFGEGRVNPSQNLVDAFGTAIGYPINHASAIYDPLKPYVGRDPRLGLFIVYDSSGVNTPLTNVIRTRVEDLKDGLNQTNTSTRTGYYLKKLLMPAVNLTPPSPTTARHYYPIFRYTEMFLNYAEAANEAWGYDDDPMGYGFTPKTIIARIRTRAGIAAADPYLTSIASDDDMRTLIRNERRIELSFEGYRFWDMRRWGLPLGETAKGVSIENRVPTIIDVETRNYSNDMIYGPIPYQETLKSNKILQNKVWVR